MRREPDGRPDRAGSADDAASRRYRLVRRADAGAPIEPSAEQRAVIDHDRGRLKVLAGPGTGKTTTLVGAIADRVEMRGIDPASILVLTFSRRAAAELSSRVAARLHSTTTEPVVRTIHSYAYATVRNAALAAGAPAPRLLEAGQADLMVREILAGHADDGGRYWPGRLHAALRVPAFAVELRELMLRAAERGITPRRIAALGKRRDRPEWVAVARFIEEYRDIGDLRRGTTGLGPKLDQAELTTAALDCLADPAILAAERARVRRIFVDEYQDVDPAQAALIETIASGADELVVVGDPDQSIYAFRGSEPGAMARMESDRVVDLTVSRRLPPVLIAATRAVASRIPGLRTHRDLAPGGENDGASLEVRTLRSAHQEAAFVADRLRRLHLVSGIPYARMAVILRSPMRGGDQIRRALVAAGVPVAFGATGPLAADPVVATLLTILRVGTDLASLDGDTATSLLTSPLGGMDALSVRRLRRDVRVAALRRGDAAASRDLIAAILRGEAAAPVDLARDLAEPLSRIAALVDLAVRHHAEPAAETVLWGLWQKSGLADDLESRSAGTGVSARRAAQHLDAVVTLFERAADLATQLPSAGVRGLLDVVADELIPAASQASDADAVTVLSAHAAKGLEWDVVAVAAVQDETWPDLRPRTSLIGFDELFDAADDIESALPVRGALADERRLFYVATTRARRHLIVTAVDDGETSPSRFLLDLTGTEPVATGWPLDADGRAQRELGLQALVAELRATVCAPRPWDEAAATAQRDDARRSRAAHTLAVLCEAGVRGADPAEWYGLGDLSTDRPLSAPGQPVVLSPSQVESALQCPLRTALVRHGGEPQPGQAQLVGSAVHALAQGLAAGASSADMDGAIEQFLDGLQQLPAWQIGRLRRRMQAMRGALEEWYRTQASSRTFIASEIAIDVDVPGEGGRPVHLRGRVDWLSAAQDGAPIVTDFKTGSVVPSVAAAQEHPQLAVYQLAIALGALAGDQDAVAGDHGALAGDGPRPGGAELVYVHSGRPAIRSQDAQSAAESEAWAARLQRVAEESVGPTFLASAGDYCDRCPVRGSCPLQPEGRSVTR